MKKTVAVLITLVLFLPASCWAKGEALKEKFEIADINQSQIIENGNLLSTTVDLTMLDGNEFIIPVTIDKKNITLTFMFASGKTVMVSPSGIEVTEGSGYQDYDDMDNTINFFRTYDTTTCLLNIVGYLITPFPIDLIFLYYIFVTCF
jgi:hypothetical protein